MTDTLYTLMRHILWLTATAFGSISMIFLAASFAHPPFAATAIAAFAIASAALYARNQT